MRHHETVVEKVARKALSTSRQAVTGRRSQAERRAASREALLEAALQCLAENGYAGLTTRRVSELAGLSQGIQMHYFPTKTHLLTEAVRHIAGRIAAEVVANPQLRALEDADRIEAALDEVWRIHTSPLGQATMELWAAARTEPDLRESLRTLERDITRMIFAGAVEVFPAETARSSFSELLVTVMSTIRGLAMLVPVSDPQTLEAHWQTTKRLMLEAAGRFDLQGRPHPG